VVFVDYKLEQKIYDETKPQADLEQLSGNFLSDVLGLLALRKEQGFAQKISSNNQITATGGVSIGGKTLATANTADNLAKLTNPFLTIIDGRVEAKFKAALSAVQLGIRQNHAGPAQLHLNDSIKVVRMVYRPERQGLISGRMHQKIKLNDQVIHCSLGTTHRWTESNFGDLLITGTWHEICTAVAQAGAMRLVCDISSGQESVYFEDAGQMNFFVSCSLDKLALTTEQGEVVLDAATELVQVAGSAVTGFAGGGVDFAGQQVLEILSAANEALGFTAEKAEDGARRLVRRKRLDRDSHVFAVRVGINAGEKGHAYVDTDSTELNNVTLHRFLLDAFLKCCQGVGI
jgi:hypothetical protein